MTAPIILVLILNHFYSNKYHQSRLPVSSTQRPTQRPSRGYVGCFVSTYPPCCVGFLADCDMGLVAELPPKLARAPAGRGDFDPRMGGTLSTHSAQPEGTWVRVSFRARSSSFPESLGVSETVLVLSVDRTLSVHEAVGSILRETHFSHFSHELYCVWHTASFGSGMKTASAGPLLAPPCAWGDARWRMQAVWWLVWPKLFGPGARAIVEDPQRSHAPAACEPPHSDGGAWPLYAVPPKWSAKCYAPPQ